MKKYSKLIALLLAMLMVTTLAPLSVWAEAPSSTGAGFVLVIDGNGVNDDDVVSAGDTNGTVPSGTGLYTKTDCTDADKAGKYIVTPVGLDLDWNEWYTIFPGYQTTAAQEICFKIFRETGSIAEEKIESDGSYDEDDASYGDEQVISIIDGTTKVKVLNVYPCPASENLLKEWLGKAYEGTGRSYTDDFEITTVPIDAKSVDTEAPGYSGYVFNNDYNAILKDANNVYKYDVIFFGTSDGNGSAAVNEFYDLTSASADAVEAFIKNGRGVLFGHDTICSADHLDGNGDNGEGFANFSRFADYLDIELIYDFESSKAGSLTQKDLQDFTSATRGTDSGWEPSEEVKVTNTALLTSYPFAISGTFEVPETHTLYQRVTSSSDAVVWLQLQDTLYPNRDKDSRYLMGDEFAAYLMTNDNVAMIQTGHSSLKEKASDGEAITATATINEGRVIANTLFYLMQKSLGHFTTDGDFVDKAAPVIIETEAEFDALYQPQTTPQEFGADISVEGSDIGTFYNYWVEAYVDGTEVSSSNVLEDVEAISYFKGYLVSDVQSARPDDLDAFRESMISDAKDPDDDTERTVIVDYETDGDLEFNVSGMISREESYYVYIIPVDNASNCGEMVEVELNLRNLHTPEVSTGVDTVVDENDDGVDADVEEESRFDTDDEGNVTDTYYYPHNYEDKNGDAFFDDYADYVEDTEVTFEVSASVDTLSRSDVVGVITITKWVVDENGNKTTEIDRLYTEEELAQLESVDPTIVYGETYTKDITVDIDEIYLNDEDYDTNGEYTITINWYVKDEETGEPTDELVATDSTDITIMRPDFKVTFEFKDYDEDGKVVDTSEDQIVKYGDAAKVPSSVKGSLTEGSKTYVRKEWSTDDYKNVVEDLTVTTTYNIRSNNGTPEIPVLPETPSEDGKDVELIRLGGATRIETAIEISKKGWEEANVVILATANLFPDAMAGVPLAKAVDAPILLTVNGEKLEDAVKAEIARLDPEKVYILGQTAAVNANIEAELKALYEVERVGGKDRFGTSAMIAYELEEIYGKKAEAVYFVRSDMFPDALSVSAVAAIEHNPILYVAPDGSIDSYIAEYCKTIGTKATIIGGTAAVSTVGENNIKAMFTTVDRLYGADRYATSVAICNARAKLFTGDGTALATGLKFPDALTGGAFAAKNNIPVLLVNGSVSPELAVYLANRPITKLYVFGGTAAVSDSVAYTALSYCRYPIDIDAE